MRHKKPFIIVPILFGALLFFSRCIENSESSKDPRGNVYVGSASCRNCHKAIYDSYVATVHHDATRPAKKTDIGGSFSTGENSFSIDSVTKIVLEDRKSGLYQVAYKNGKEVETHQIDITFGLKHAQTFLSWQGNQSFELPVSYYVSAKSWGLSPGFPASEAYFKRSVGSECYECHSSYVDSKLEMLQGQVEEDLNKNTLLYGIDCERCHGPAINHVNFHLAYPDVKEAKYIVTQRSLSKQQKLDACAVCHSGNDKVKEKSTFAFKPGDTLANFFLPWGVRKNRFPDVDVHGNQYQLLLESKCFLGSKTMTCITCHDPHTNASSNLVEYSQKCVSCHQNTIHASLATGKTNMNEIKNNCIDCHMPKKASQAITFYLSGSSDKSSYLLRTHKIAIYSNDTAVVNNLVSFIQEKRVVEIGLNTKKSKRSILFKS